MVPLATGVWTDGVGRRGQAIDGCFDESRTYRRPVALVVGELVDAPSGGPATRSGASGSAMKSQAPSSVTSQNSCLSHGPIDESGQTTHVGHGIISRRSRRTRS